MYFGKLRHKRRDGQILGKNIHGEIHKSFIIWLLSYYLYLPLFKIFTDFYWMVSVCSRDNFCTNTSITFDP